MQASRNQREGKYQGAMTRFGEKWGDIRSNRQGRKRGKRHIRSTYTPEEPVFSAFRGAARVTVGAVANVIHARAHKKLDREYQRALRSGKVKQAV